MKKLRILAICHEDPEYILGGMGMHCRKLYEAMAATGEVDIDFLTSGPGEGSKQYLGYTKYQSDKLVCWKPQREDLSSLLLSDIQIMRTFSQLLAKGYRWDVVHIHEWTAVQIGRMVRDSLNIPLIGTMHLCITKLSDIDDGSPKIDHTRPMSDVDVYLRQQEGHLVVTDSDELILCSQAYIDMAREVFLTDRPINLVHNGIDTKEWYPGSGDGIRARKKNFILSSRPICLYVGRIADMKGIRVLLDAIERTDTGYCVVLAGEVNATTEAAKESWDVTRRIRTLQEVYPERLRWVGFNHGQDLRDLYTAAEVVVMPSIHEPFGIVALEAMAMGVPLVSTEVDGLGEIVCSGLEEYAMIIKPNNPDDLIAGLRIVREKPEVRSELVSLGLKRAAEFTWGIAALKTMQVYHTAIERAAQRAVAV